MKTGSIKHDQYDQYTYEGLVNRIRDGVSLTEHQKQTMEKCGLTVEDFRNQRTTEEKIALVNQLRGVGAMPTLIAVPKATFDRLWNCVLPCQRRIIEGELSIVITQRKSSGNIEAVTIKQDLEAAEVTNPLEVKG